MPSVETGLLRVSSAQMSSDGPGVPSAEGMLPGRDPERRARADSSASTWSTRRGLSATVKLRKVSVAPVVVSRTVRLKRSAEVRPKLASQGRSGATS